MLYSGTNPESYITEYTLVYEDKPETRTRQSWATSVRPLPALLILVYLVTYDSG